MSRRTYVNIIRVAVVEVSEENLVRTTWWKIKLHFLF